jgi:ATP-dependent Zn protease
MNNRTRTAYHEAGHAVIGHLLGATVKEVVLKSDISGKCYADIPKGWTYANEMHFTLAGPVCEAVVSRDSMYDVLAHITGETSDGHTFLNCAATLLPTPRTKPYTVVKQHAKIVRQMIIENRQLIDTIAQNLLAMDKLSEDEISRLLRSE